MNKKRVPQIVAGTILMAISVVAGASLAWFSPSTNVGGDQGKTNVLPIDGSTASSYFAYGDGYAAQSGTTHRPFGIKTPRQLYNLAWLQYLGYFENEQRCFELAANLNMSGWVLPPIGTEDNPFVSYFDGQGHTISNLTVSNDFTKYNVHPSSMTAFDDTEGSTKKTPHILGLFGVVGDYNGDVFDYSSGANELVDTGIFNITVKTVVKDSLMGLAAGYVSATMSNVAVEKGTIDIDKSISTATTSYGNYTPNISDYTLVGYSTTKASFKKVSETVYDVSVKSGQDFIANAQGKNKGWGGSIDMNSMFQRLEDFEEDLDTTNNDDKTEYPFEIDHVYGVGEITATEVPNEDNQQNIFKVNKYEDPNNLILDEESGEYVPSPLYYGSVIDYIDHTDKHYLGGGEYHVNAYQQPNQTISTRIDDGKGNYMVGSPSNHTDGSNNAGSLASTRTASSATQWQIVENGNGVRIHAVLPHQEVDSDYYLYVSGTTVRLSLSETARTYFTKETIDDNGVTKIRYTYTSGNNKYYLGFNNTTWALIQIPANNVTKPSIPDYPIKSEYDAQKMEMPADAASTKQIYATSGGSNYYLTGSSSGIRASKDALFSSGWELSLPSSGTSSSTIKIHGQDYYLYSSSNSNVSINANSWSWSITKNSSAATYRIRRASNGNTLRYNNNTFSLNNSSTYLNVKTTQDCVNEFNAAIDAQYQAAIDAFNDAVYYCDVTYPSLLEDYEQTLKDTYYINFSNSTTTTNAGTYNTYDHDSSWFEYDSSNTTYLPINVYDKTTYDTDNPTVLLGHKDEAMVENTGYFVAGATGSTWAEGTDSTNCPRSIVFSSYDQLGTNGKLRKCYSTANGFDDSTIYTIDSSGVHSIVQNGTIDTERFFKYYSSKSGLETVLKNSQDQKVGGFHFFAKNFDYGKVSKDRVLLAKNVRIRDESKAEYELPVNSLDFYLKEKGRINFLAGMYNGGGGYGTANNDHMNGFFSFHHVIRDGDTEEILDIKEIKCIYEDTSTHEYVYTYKDGFKIVDKTGAIFKPTNSNLNLLFDTDWIGYRDLDGDSGRVYYFEIPVDEGEYCFGGYDVPSGISSADGAYLMYLDIGAGATKIQRTTFAEHFLEVTSINSHPLGVALISVDSITGEEPTFNDNNSFCAVIKNQYKGQVIVVRETNTVKITRDADNRNFVKPSYISDTIQSVVDPGYGNNSVVGECVADSRIEKEIYRVQYFDYDVNHSTLRTTKVEDTRTRDTTINSQASWGALTRKIYQKFETGDFVELTAQTQIDSGDILIFKFFGPTGTNATYNGQVWDWNDIKVTNSLVYYNGSSTVTTETICSTLLTPILEMYFNVSIDGTNPPDVTAIEYQLDVLVDTPTGTANIYYKFGDYLIVPTVINDKVVFVVTSIVSGKTIYIVNTNTPITATGNYEVPVTPVP